MPIFSNKFIAFDFKNPALAGKQIISTAVLCIIAICALVGLSLNDSYRWTKERAVQTSENIGALIDHDISRNIEFFDLSLQAVVDGVNNPKIMALEPSLRQATLFDRAASADGLGSILVLDEEGNVILDSRTTQLPINNFSDRDYFQVHRTSSSVGLYVSRPYQSRLRAGEWMIGISRRLSHSDGSFAGVIVGGISLSYFQHVFQSIQLGKDSAVTLLSDEGFFLARHPFIQLLIGEKIPAVNEQVGREPSGVVEKTAFDGVRRIYAYHKMNRLPFIVSVGTSSEQVFAEWWRRAIMTSIGVLFLSLIILILAVRVDREFRRRKQIESELASLATTDPLTGIANRRRFDECLNLEWARVRRSGAILCVLMIDVDFFKSYNDFFGHQAGDAALKAVADCFQSITKRPADLVARYGGEEFAVLLPNTDECGAKYLADQMRAAVEALNIASSLTPGRILTVSIGVGSLYPSEVDDSLELLREADRALYSAKSSGRNRVCRSRNTLKLVSAPGQSHTG